MDMYSALQYAQKQMTKVMDNAFVVDNLLASAFLNASGKVVKLSSEILQDRPEGITLFLFYCRIYLNQEYSSIKRDPFSFVLP